MLDNFVTLADTPAQAASKIAKTAFAAKQVRTFYEKRSSPGLVSAVGGLAAGAGIGGAIGGLAGLRQDKEERNTPQNILTGAVSGGALGLGGGLLYGKARGLFDEKIQPPEIIAQFPGGQISTEDIAKNPQLPQQFIDKTRKTDFQQAVGQAYNLAESAIYNHPILGSIPLIDAVLGSNNVFPSAITGTSGEQLYTYLSTLDDKADPVAKILKHVPADELTRHLTRLQRYQLTKNHRTRHGRDFGLLSKPIPVPTKAIDLPQSVDWDVKEFFRQLKNVENPSEPLKAVNELVEQAEAGGKSITDAIRLKAKQKIPVVEYPQITYGNLQDLARKAKIKPSRAVNLGGKIIGIAEWLGIPKADKLRWYEMFNEGGWLNRKFPEALRPYLRGNRAPMPLRIGGRAALYGALPLLIEGWNNRNTTNDLKVLEDLLKKTKG